MRDRGGGEKKEAEAEKEEEVLATVSAAGEVLQGDVDAAPASTSRVGGGEGGEVGILRVLMRSRWRAGVPFVLGVAQAACAGTYGNWFGVTVGVVAAVVGVGVVAAQVPAEAAEVDDNGKPLDDAAAWRVRLAEAARGAPAGALTGVLAACVAVLLAVRAASPDPAITRFPGSCGEAPSSSAGCARLALESSWRMEEGETPPSTTSLSGAEAFRVTRDFFEGGAIERCAILRADVNAYGGFLHARCVTLVMGYADDVFVRVRTDGADPDADADADVVSAEIQSQLRLGVGDLEANPERIRAFVAYVRPRFA